MAHRYGLPGKIYLAGAVPGPAKLLSMHTIEVLQGADIVFHDEQVSEEVLGLIPARVAVKNVGKLGNLPEGPKEEIHKRIIRAAVSGQTVVLLKGVDPSILDHTQDETAALCDAGIIFESIPEAAAASTATAGAQTTLPHDKRNELVLDLPPQAELLSN